MFIYKMEAIGNTEAALVSIIYNDTFDVLRAV